MKTIDADILIIGSGITAALMAAKLAETTKRTHHGRRSGKANHSAG